MLVLHLLTPKLDDATAARWLWVRSRDGQHSDAHGEDATPDLPRDGDCVLVMAPRAVRWHHLNVPPHPSAKRAAVLAGVLDASVLGEPEDLHVAVANDFKGQGETWCAVTERDALQAQLDELRRAGLRPSRIVPLIAPGDAAQALAWGPEPWHISLAGPNGVVHVGGAQELASLSDLGNDAAQAWAQLQCPSHLAAAVESAWPEQRMQVLSALALLMQASASPWNLAQFEFRVSAAQRRTQGLQHAWRQLRHAPAWRPVRGGVLVALLAALVLPPVWAWRERQIVQQLDAQARAVVQESFPDIALVIDPVAQMRRAVDELASSRGGAQAQGLAVLLSALSEIPQARVSELRWQAQQADLVVSGVDDRALQGVAGPLGWTVSAQGPQRWRLTRREQP